MTRFRLAPMCALAAALLVAACGKTELYADLREREANEMLSLLLRAGIATDKVAGKGGVVTISVDSKRVPEAMDLLNAAGLPRDRFANIGDLFKKEGLISSPSEERVRYIYGTTQELSRTLTGIDGVLSARVHVVLPNNDPSDRQTKPASAAVLIRYAANAPIEMQVPKIKELVVNSIEGLQYERVSVVLVRAQEIAPAERAQAVVQVQAEEDGSLRALRSLLAAAGLPYDIRLLWVGAAALVASLLVNAIIGAVLLLRRRPRGGALTASVP